MNSSPTTSSLLWRLLGRVCGKPYGEAMVGDMQEEFASEM